MNNYWWTNFPASQGGRYWFNYAMTSRKAAFSPMCANKFGWSTYFSLSAAIMEGKKDLAKYKVHSFLKDIPDNIMLVTIKEVEFQKGIVLKLMEIAGKRGKLSLRFFDGNIKKAYLATPTEEEISDLNVSDGGIRVNFKPWKIITIKVEF